VAPILANTADIANDDHPRRDPDPAPHRRVCPWSQGSDRCAQFERRPDRLLGVVLMRRRITEEDERGVAEMAGDEPAVAADDVRDAVLKGADGLETVFEIRAVGSPRDADQLA